MDGGPLWELLLTGVMRGGLYALMAVGLSLVFGVMNIPQFAHGEFYMLGAYIAYFVFQGGHWPAALAIPLAAAAGFLVGALIERALFLPLRRRSKDQWTLNSFLLTVGLSFVLQNGALALWGANYRGVARYWSGSLSFGTTMSISMDRVVGFGIAMVSIAFFWLFLARTRTGRAIRAVAEDETGAQLVGINLDRIQSLTFALSTMLAALAGASLLSINPAHPSMGSEALYKSWYVVILSGLGNVGGAIPGGFLLGILETLSYYVFGSGWQDVISLSVLIVILLVKPGGLFGSEVKGIWER